ncbi:MAG: hypothetical protein OXO52_22680 [Rhodospirillales bacterium]|nr:hypothetical protein [Rhodospirillales bacterium]MDE0382019.1 hypothetical protein [Rhodospirillales bacterium]
MTKAQAALRAAREAKSQNRQRLAEIGLMAEADVTDEIRAEQDRLEAAVPDLERRERAAQVAVDNEEAEQRAAGDAARQPEGDAEDRERAELRRKVRLSGYVTAAVEQRAADGAEAEYNAALGIAGNRFPLSLLAPPVEERATTDTNTTTTPRRWLDRLFAGSAADHLGITMESVPAGEASFPVTTAGASAAQRGRSEAAADAAWTLGITELKPTRNAVRLVFNVEDAARIPGLESALTRDLRMALAEGVDRAIFLGDDGANENAADITGLQTATGVTEATVTQANKVKGPETLTAFTGLVDGIHAGGLGDLNVVAAIGAWRLWESTIINSAADNMTLAAFLREAGLSWSARGEIEAATGNGKFGAFIGRRMGIDGAGVAAVWEAGELIRDPYSGAGKGEVALTLCYLWAFGLPRASNFARLKFVT